LERIATDVLPDLLEDLAGELARLGIDLPLTPARCGSQLGRPATATATPRVTAAVTRRC